MARTLSADRTPKKSKSSLSMWFKLGLVVLVAFCGYKIIKQEIAIYQIKQEQAATQKRLDELKKQKAELEAERKRLDDPKHIERLARDDYNMVGPNEVPLFVVDPNKKK